MASLAGGGRARSRVLPVAALLLVVAVPVLAAALGDEPEPPAPGDRRELVVLVHGMGRTKLSMWPLERALEREGYRVLNWGYSSTSEALPELGAALADAVEHQAGAAPRVHFVGHSLGGILTRWVLAHSPPPRPGRVVMLAPPNQGAAAAGRAAPYLAWLVPSVEDLRPDSGSVRALPLPAGIEVGVVAGAHDGKVTVAETHLPGEREHVLVPSAHSFIMNRGDVQALVVRFLRTGSFGRDAPPAHPLPGLQPGG